MSTCLTNDPIDDKRKMAILSEETFFESGQLFKKNFQSLKALYFQYTKRVYENRENIYENCLLL